MSRSRAIVALLALVLALPSAAFAQGAGDEQYQDPFGDEQAQNGGGDGDSSGNAAQDDGLDPEPPIDPDPDPGPGPDPDPGPDPGPTPDPDDPALPNTGSDPGILAFVGLLFLMTGLGLRLRTLDPDDF